MQSLKNWEGENKMKFLKAPPAQWSTEGPRSLNAGVGGLV